MKKLVYFIVFALVSASMVFAGGSSEGAVDVSKSAANVDTHTVAVGAVVIARDDVPTDEIYAIVSSIFDNKDAITAQHAKGKELDLAFASSVTAVPYHPGAAKYFAEKGYNVASVKDGAGNGKASSLSFGTGGDTGTYYGFGSVLAGMSQRTPRIPSQQSHPAVQRPISRTSHPTMFSSVLSSPMS